MRKIICGMIIVLLIVSFFSLAFTIQLVKAEPETVYIKADGAVEPSSAPILNVGNVYYTFTDDISGSLVVERDNIVVDGAGHVLEGTETGNGTSLTGRSNVTIKSITIKDFNYGIYLLSSSGNTLSENNISSNWMDGIYLSQSSGNSIFANNITDNEDYSIALYSSSNGNSISANNITNNRYGIVLYSSSGNSISTNNITDNPYGDGIELSSSSGNSISANNITSTWFGIYLYSSSNSNSISANNITDNHNGIDLSYSSNGNSISANNINNSTYFGIDIYSSSGNSISTNNITDTWFGIGLSSSSGNSISANKITDNHNGIGLWSSSSNSISANNITNNANDGIWLYSSSSNSVSANTITYNDHGIYPYNSSSNLICHNNFAGNTVQAKVTLGYVNIWDDGYPSGGNYWSDYAGVDLYKGPNQNVPGSDGIGDAPYVIDANNWDNYPLMNPYTAITDVASLVVRGGDNKVWYRTYSGTWGSWYPITAATGDSLGAAMLGNNLHIVARDMSGTTIWHGYVNLATNMFSGWTLISGHPVSAPTLASNGTVLCLVVRGGDNRVWYRTYSGGVWGSWHSIVAATGDSLGAAMLGNNLHIVARNMAGTTIWHSYVNVATNVFSGWTLISGHPVSVPTLASNSTVLSLVVRGNDNRVWYRTYSGGVWGGWYPIAAATGDSLGAAMLGNNLHIVARNLAGTTIWHSYVDLTTNAFSGWTLISGKPISKPTLTS